MKTKTIIMVLMATVLAISPISAKKEDPNKQTVVFCIDDMECQSCKVKIEKNIAFEKGVKAMEVSLDKKTVEVTFDNRKNNVESLQGAFKKIGYEAKVSKKEDAK
ncbi:heavy-metal-associated domain-containing protein [Paludibacter sp.]